MQTMKLFAVAILATSLLMACGGDEEVEGDDETEEEAPEEGDDSDAAGPTGQLNYAFNAQPATLDVQFTTATATRDIGRHIFESLVTLDSEMGVQPMLAEDYDINDDGSEVTFYLREGIQFHNGEEMTADDVVASMEKWKGEAGQALTYMEELEFEPVDDYTVVAHNGDPTTIDLPIYADYSQMAAIMPESVIEDAGADGVNDYIGTGPFQFEEWVQDQHVHLSAFEDYQPRSEPTDGHAGEKLALVEDIYFEFIEDVSTRINGLQTGEYDMIHATPHDNADMIEEDPNLENYLYQESFGGMVLNNEEGFFADDTAREALNAALNPEAMLMAAYGDEEYIHLENRLTFEGTEWTSDAGEEIYNTYDPELAEELLEEMGYDGEPITILATREYQDYFDMGVVAQQQMEEVGMNVEFEAYEWSTILDMRDDPSNWDGFMGGFTFRPLPVQQVFLSSGQAWPGWTDSEEIDTAIDNILYADSLEDAFGYSDDLQQAFWEYLPMYKPGSFSSIISHHSNVEGLDVFYGPMLWNVSVEEDE